MLNSGWLKVYRELKDNAIWRGTTPEQKAIFMTILMMVNYKESEWEWHGKKYKVMPGQMITSLESIKKESGRGISIQNVRTAIKKFEEYGFLTNQSTNRDRLITVVNWGVYQSNNDGLTRQVTSNQQTDNMQLTTIEEYKNKKMKKMKSGEFANVELSDEEKIKLKDKYGDSITKDFIDRLDRHIESTGREYQNHYATILVWIEKEPMLKKDSQSYKDLIIDI